MQLTSDAGGAWTDLTPALATAGAPTDRWVSRVFASPLGRGDGVRREERLPQRRLRAVSLPHDRLRQDVDSRSPAICPHAPINVVVQDRRNAHLLFVGNDLGVFVSIDDGGALDAAEGQPADRGSPRSARSIRARTISSSPRTGARCGPATSRRCRNSRRRCCDEAAHLFDIKPKARYGFGRQGMNYDLFGDKYLEVPNEPEAFVVSYYLLTAQRAAQVTVEDAAGAVVRQIDAPGDRGLNRVLVPLATDRSRGAAGRGSAAPPPPLGVGTYRITLTVAGRTLTKPARVIAWP